MKFFFIGFGNGFKEFGSYITNFINFILLSIVYFTVIGLTSIIGKLFRKRFLPIKNSAWFDINKKNKEDFDKPF